MTRYLIVKYAMLHRIERASKDASVAHTYSAQQCGITTTLYADKADADRDCGILTEFNPTVDYGVVVHDPTLDVEETA